MSDIKPPATVQDLMKASGLGRETVKALIREGRLPGQKLGKKYVVPRGEFERWYAGEWKPQPAVNVTPLIRRKAG